MPFASRTNGKLGEQPASSANNRPRRLAYAGVMNKGTLWTIVGVVVAVVIAWVLVNVLFSLIAFAFKLLAVAVVAVIVYFVLRSVFRRTE